jgi:uncharacterized membrane protein YfcA
MMDGSFKPPLRLGLRTARRLSVVALVALIGGYLGAAVMGEAPGFGVLKLVGLLGAAALFLDARGQQANAPDRMLDERERRERDRAYVLAYQAIVGAMFVALVYTVPAQGLGWWLPDAAAMRDMLSGFAIAALALPGVFLAWRTPAEAADLA